MNKIKVLILGSDANAYFMARCSYEAFHEKAHIIGKNPLAFTKFSNILTAEYVSDIWNEDVFVRVVNNYAMSFMDCSVLMVSTNETYSNFIARNQDKFVSNLFYSKQNLMVLESLINKELFYKTYANCGLVFPKTYFYDVLGDGFLPILKYPIILKPADVISYNHISFVGKRKVYKIDNYQSLKDTIKLINTSGYRGKLILQEYIAGDDSCLFDSVIYVDRHHKVKLISFAQVGLQEHSLSMIGNAATLINGFTTFKEAPVKKMKEAIIKFMENINYTGFAEIDMKYDVKSHVFKVLEINARQGRSSYYISKIGGNLIQVLVDDLILKKDLSFQVLDDEVLLSFVPKSVVKRYVKNDEFRRKALEMWKLRVSPMECKLDKNFKRYLVIKKRLWHYKRDFKKADWMG